MKTEEIQKLADKMLDAKILNTSEHERVGDILSIKNCEKNALDYIIMTVEDGYANGVLIDEQAEEWFPQLGIPINGGRPG